MFALPLITQVPPSYIRVRGHKSVILVYKDGACERKKSCIELEVDRYDNKLAVFRHLFHAYYAKLHRYAFTILKDNHRAEDIVQNVFLKLWKNRDDILIGDKIGSYLYTTTYHFSLNYIRNHKVREQYMREAAGIANPPVDDVNEGIAASELSVHIHTVIEKLPARCRTVFLKSRVEGKKYAEIAAEMNISVKTVEVQIGKALKIFRKELKDYL